MKETHQKNISTPLLKTSVKNRILKGIFIHGAAVLSLFILFLSAYSDLNFIGWFVLFVPPLVIIMDHHRKKKLIALPYGDEERWEAISFNEKELQKQAISTIIPSFESRYRNLSTIKKWIWVPISYIFIACIYFAHLGYLLALMVYFLMFFRCFLAFLQIKGKNNFISIIDNILVIPVFRFTRFYDLKIPLSKIKEFEVVGSQENMDMTRDGDAYASIDSVSGFMQGLFLHSEKIHTVALSTVLVDPDFLYRLFKALPSTNTKDNKIQIRLIQTGAKQ